MQRLRRKYVGNVECDWEGLAGESAETRPQQDLIKHAEGEERGEGGYRGGE